MLIEAPSTETMNTGSTLWISSDETSMNSEPNPSAQMPAGSAFQDTGAGAGELRSSEGTAPIRKRPKGPHHGVLTRVLTPVT